MLQFYLKIAWRNLLLRRFYSLLNTVGLAVGITFAALIGGSSGQPHHEFVQ